MLVTLRGCLLGLVGGAVDLARRAPCACVGPRPSPRRPRTPPPAHPEPPTATASTARAASAPVPAAFLDGDTVVPEAGGEMPPGPWRWRWVWPTPGRPAGMALVAADGTLVLWSPGGFASPGDPNDGRPTPDVADALAALPDLTGAAAGTDALRAELDRARAVADETRRLLARAADAVDDEIGRASGGTEADEA